MTLSTIRKMLLSAIAAIVSTSLLQTTSAHDGSALGKVHFPTSCNAPAQQRFDQAMLYQHSFWYREARTNFEEALAADPGCAIASWGIALSLLFNPHVAPPAQNLAQGASALDKAKALGAKTQRERDYIDALAAFYADNDKPAHGERVQRYLAALTSLAQRYPDDDEAQIALAITLNVAASPGDKTYAKQLQGAAILEPIFRRQPMHPGVAHYLVHLYDYPAIAHKGLDAAQRYAAIAPAAPHALHMPSHIFTRVGYWKESVASNAASAIAAKAGNEPDDQLHAMDYLVYAHLQLAQDTKARAVVDEMARTTGFRSTTRTGPFAIAASEARYMIERGDWTGAAALRLRPSQFAYVDAITCFARALGNARGGDLQNARDDIARLSEQRDRLQQAKDSYWAEQVDIQRQVATAWLLNAEGKRDDALQMMKAVADQEDRTEKSIVTPGPLAPARELYGAMLLEHGMAAEALAQFTATLDKEPNRFNAFAGAAESAKRLGDMATARSYYEKLASLGADGQSQRPVLVAARQSLAAPR